MWFLKPTAKLEFHGITAFELLLNETSKQTKATQLVRIDELSQLIVNESGLSADGLSWTTAAFQQLCVKVSGGLFSMLASLWADSDLPQADRARAFLRIYHNSVSMVKSKLIGLRLVVDKVEKLIVGVVGGRYKFVANSELLRMVHKQFASSGDYRSFYASLNHRDMCLIGASKSLFRRDSDIVFRQGVAIFNSETTRQAVYVPQLIFDSVSGGYSVEPVTTKNRLVHRPKRGFAQELDATVSSAMHCKTGIEQAVDGYKRCAGELLWRSGEEKAVRLPGILAMLRDKEIGALAINTVNRSLEGLRSASLWDLYQSLVVTAATGRSERILRVNAYKLLHKARQ